ncbi:hypothetical protein Ciccas_013097, partial [Cichlidogyrus casuarinus]
MLPDWMKVFFIFIICLLIGLALFGNLLVCVAVCKDRYLRRKANSLYVSLALADLILASVVMVCAVIEYHLGHWPFGLFLCKLYIGLDVMCSTASILNLVAIACDRYIHIRRPFWYRDHCGKLSLALTIFLVWLASGLVSFIPIFLDWHKQEGAAAEADQIRDGGCKIKFNVTYAIASSSLSFYLPTMVMLCIYARLYSLA